MTDIKIGDRVRITYEGTVTDTTGRIEVDGRVVHRAATVERMALPEPGLWGVVEASWDSRQPAGIPRAEWVRTKGNEWRSCISNVAVRWDDLIDPTLIREGVAS